MLTIAAVRVFFFPRGFKRVHDPRLRPVRGRACPRGMWRRHGRPSRRRKNGDPKRPGDHVPTVHIGTYLLHNPVKSRYIYHICSERNATPRRTFFLHMFVHIIPFKIKCLPKGLQSKILLLQHLHFFSQSIYSYSPFFRIYNPLHCQQLCITRAKLYGGI